MYVERHEKYGKFVKHFLYMLGKVLNFLGKTNIVKILSILDQTQSCHN